MCDTIGNNLAVFWVRLVPQSSVTVLAADPSVCCSCSATMPEQLTYFVYWRAQVPDTLALTAVRGLPKCWE